MQKTKRLFIPLSDTLHYGFYY